MKKVIIKFLQWILMYRKKLIYLALALFIGQFCFLNIWWIWIENEVFAADSTTQSNSFQEQATKWLDKVSFLQKMVYIFIYPMLVVAWKLVDNSFVYWEIFWFDAVLWQLWNIVRNLANFTLWFIFIFYIFKYLVSEDKKNSPKKIIVKSLIAWIWIQASRFIMATLVDISTILTYSIWWLPISVLKQNTSDTSDQNLEHNPYVLKSVVYLDVKDIDTLSTYLTNTPISGNSAQSYYISECETFSYKYDTGARSEEILLAPKMIYYADEKWNITKTKNNACHHFWQVYYFSKLYDGISIPSCEDAKDCRNKQTDYANQLSSAIQKITSNNKSEVISLINDARLLEVWNAHETGGVIWWLGKVYGSDMKDYGLDLYNQRTWKWNTNRLQDVLDWNSYVWVFTALYSSLINSVWVIPSDAWTFAALLNAALSLWHMLAIWIPLIAVAVVFMMRIWILWVAIALAPFIVLLTAFELWNNDSIKSIKFLDYLKPENLIRIIFSPAIICFAISISTVLVTIIMGLNVNGIGSIKNEILWWLITMNVSELTLPIWKLAISVIWIAVTWFLVWAAIETSKLWESGIVKGMKDLATSALWSMPIVPIVWKDADWNIKTSFVWTSTAFGWWWIVSKVMDAQIQEYKKGDSEIINNFIDPDRVKKKRDDYYKDQITKVSDISWDWRSYEITIQPDGSNGSPIKYKFTDVADNRKKDIIDAINAMDKEKRKKFVGDTRTVSFNDWNEDVVYEFDDTNGYVKK